MERSEVHFPRELLIWLQCSEADCLFRCVSLPTDVNTMAVLCCEAPLLLAFNSPKFDLEPFSAVHWKLMLQPKYFSQVQIPCTFKIV
jgi:hypothetical protein